MPVLMLVVAIVILAGVVVVASGRGGELAPEYPDYPPIDLGPVTAADVALLRPPSAAWGYNMRVTNEALETIAQAVTERDVKISALQQEVSDLREQLAPDVTRGSVSPGTAVRAEPGTPVGGAQPDEGPGSAQPVWSQGDESQRAEPPWADSEWVEPLWAGPETGEPGTAEPHWAGPHRAPPGTGAWEASPAGEVPRQAPSYEESSYQEPLHEASSHVEPAPESSPEEPSSQESFQDGPAYGAAQYAAWDDPDDEVGWDDSQQTLVWGAAHQRAKASRLQEQTQPGRAEDTPGAGASDQDTPGAGASDAPNRDRPGQGIPRQDPASGDRSGLTPRAEDAPTEDSRGDGTTGPAPTGHRAEVTAPAHYDEGRRPARAEQDRE